MANKKSTTRVAPKTSPATALAASSEPSRSLKSSILKSSFSPSHLHLSLFASVIQSLDSQQLRVHDTVSGRLRSDYTPHRNRINCISWGFYGSGDGSWGLQPAKKKRRTHEARRSPDRTHGVAVIAVGTNADSIELFSPLESRVVGSLNPAHAHGTRHFEFKDAGVSSEAWSLGADGTLIQWNLSTGARMRLLPTPAESVNSFTLLQTTILVASNSSFLLDQELGRTKATFPGFKDPIHSLVASPRPCTGTASSLFLAAAHASRYVNVYDIQSSSLVGNLIADNDVEILAFRTGSLLGDDSERYQHPLAVVTKDGRVDLFWSPFDNWQNAKSKPQDLKTRSKQSTRRPEATIQFSRPDKAETPVPIVNVLFHNSDLVLALAEGSADLSFERLAWRNDLGEPLLSGFNQRTKVKVLGFGVEATNGAKDVGNSHVDEAQAAVAQGLDARDEELVNGEPIVIEISSAEEQSEDTDCEKEDQPSKVTPFTNGIHGGDTEMAGAADGELREDREEEGQELSFGDMIRAKSNGVVDVAAALPAANEQAIVSAGERVDVSTNLSMGSVLSQSLRTNDIGLLTTCLEVEDLEIVRATIERLNSDLAMTLLQKLAERLHNRPGRAGSLLVWVQWTLVAHGGYLAARPDIVKKLSSLHTSVRERARSLQPLLCLKGKLDMLEAQINLRKSIQRRNQFSSDQRGSRTPVVYVEGQEESGSESEEERPSSVSALQLKGPSDVDGGSGADDESDEDGDDAMEVDEDEDADEDSEEEGFIDDEASESGTSHDEDLGDDVDYDDVESVEGSGDEASSGSEIEVQN